MLSDLCDRGECETCFEDELDACGHECHPPDCLTGSSRPTTQEPSTGGARQAQDPAASARAPVAPRRAARATVPGRPRPPAAPPKAGGRGGETSPQLRRERAAAGTPGPETGVGGRRTGSSAPVRARTNTPAGGALDADGALSAGSTARQTWTSEADGYLRVHAPNGVVAHLQAPDAAGSNHVVCNQPPAWDGGWRGTASDTEREIAAGMPPCRRCLSVLAVQARGGKRLRRASAPRKHKKPQPETVVPLREPAISVVPGAPGLTTWNVGDEAAAFQLRREIWELPVIARFTVMGEPVSKGRARFTKRGSKTQAYTPEKTHDAEQVVGWQFRRAVPQHKLDLEKSYGVMALFFCGTRQRRDVDNMLKLILDGLNRIAWPDDEQVTEVSAKKTLTLPEHARTEVIIYQVGFVQRFTNKCDYCGQDFPIFKSTIGRRRYCSKRCADDARRQTPLTQRTCEGCGALFTGSHKRRYCNSDCMYAKGRTTVTCSRCSTEFTKQKCHVRAENYCSVDCRDSAARERHQLNAKGTCETCGGSTSKKSYRQCNACHKGGTNVTGKPKVVAA